MKYLDPPQSAESDDEEDDVMDHADSPAASDDSDADVIDLGSDDAEADGSSDDPDDEDYVPADSDDEDEDAREVLIEEQRMEILALKRMLRAGAGQVCQACIDLNKAQ